MLTVFWDIKGPITFDFLEKDAKIHTHTHTHTHTHIYIYIYSNSVWLSLSHLVG